MNDCHLPAGRPDGGQFCSNVAGPHGFEPAVVAARSAHAREKLDVLRRGEVLARGSQPVDEQVHAARVTAEARLAEHTGLDPSVVHVVEDPLTIAAAGPIAATLAEMREQGYYMPDGISIRRDYQVNPHATTQSSYAEHASTLLINFPNKAPADADPQEVVSAVFGPAAARGANATKNLSDVIVHEMAHVQSTATGDILVSPLHDSDFSAAFDYDMKGGFRDWPGHYAVTNILNVAGQVSEYAMTNPREFVAETFTKLYHGETVSKPVMDLYRFYKGPAIKHARK